MSRTLLLLGCLLALVTGSVMAEDLRKQADQYSYDGLVLKKDSRHKVVYLKEGVDWSEYTNVQILDCQVAFRKNWQRDKNRSDSGLTSQVRDSDVMRIKNEVASMFKEIFEEKVTDSKLKLVTTAGENTLLLRPSIINLDVTAPDVSMAPRNKTYVRSAGSATLFLEVYDAASGEILARYLDYKEAPDRGYLQWATRASNRHEARRVISIWADNLLEGLESIQAKPEG